MGDTGIEQQIYKDTISFGTNSIMEFLMTKTRVFREFQEMSAFVTSIYRASNYPFFVVDTDFNIQYMNPACLEFTGLTLPEVSGKMLCRNVFQSDLCPSDCAIRQAMTTKRPVIGKRVNVRDKKGERHTIVVNAGALVDGSGHVLGGFEMWRDALPDAETASRVNALMSALDDYCRQTGMLLEQLDGVMVGTGGVADRGRPVLARIRQELNALMNTCNTMQTSYCWTVMNCPPERQVQCPAFPNHGGSCWSVDYTWCDGQMQGDASEKADRCAQCAVYGELRTQHGPVDGVALT